MNVSKPMQTFDEEKHFVFNSTSLYFYWTSSYRG